MKKIGRFRVRNKWNPTGTQFLFSLKALFDGTMSDAWQESKPTHAHSRHARRRPTPRPDRGSVRRLPQWLAVIAIGMSALPSSTTRVHAFQPYLNPLDHNHKHRIGGAERWRKPGFCSRWTDESSPLPTRILSSFASSTDETSFVEADDLEALQSLFTKYSDKEGLMAKTDALKVPAIASLLVRTQRQLENYIHATQCKPVMIILHALELLRDNAGLKNDF